MDSCYRINVRIEIREEKFLPEIRCREFDFQSCQAYERIIR